MKNTLKAAMPYKTFANYIKAVRREELPVEIKKFRNLAIDKEQYSQWKKINPNDLPKTLAEFQELKYNNNEEFQQLKRQKETINSIENKNWTPQFKQKAIDTYYEFRKVKVELTDHGVARLLQRFGNEKEKIIDICKKPYKYRQREDQKLVKHYNGIAIIYTPITKELITVEHAKNRKEDWDEIENPDDI